MRDKRRERKEAAESLTEKKKNDIKNRKILYFLFADHSLVFLFVLFGYFCCTERSKSFLETNV